MTLGETIYNQRKKKNLSQEELAVQLEVSRQTISNWENNLTSPDLLQAKKLSQIFTISLDELVENELHDVLVDKVSNTEKLAGMLIKILKVIGVLLIGFLILNVISILIFAFGPRKASAQRVSIESNLSCSIEDTLYEYQIREDENGNIGSSGDEFIHNLIKEKEFDNATQMVEYIENYFKEHQGNCQ